MLVLMQLMSLVHTRVAQGTCKYILQIQLCLVQEYDLGQKYDAHHVRPDWGSNSRPPDHDNTLHVTETPSLTTRPSVTVWLDLLDKCSG